MPNFPDLKSEYEKLWAKMTIRPERDVAVTAIARKLIASKARYQDVEEETGVPWFVIAVLHNRESDADFKTYLGNGQPFNRVTTIVPKGRGPFSSWQEGAIDAIEHDGLDEIEEWTPARACFEIEKFNGFGYRNKGIPSPYLWSFTSNYTSGKYVSDGVFSASAVDKQCGAIPVLKKIMDLDGARFGSVAAPAPIATAPQKSSGWLDAIVGLFGKKTATPSAPIRKGDDGPEVEAIQRALIQAGAELVPDGDFGDITEAAVKRFQAAHGLPVTGVVDAVTGATLTKAVPSPAIIKPPLPSVLKVAPHLSTMRAITGTKEFPGAANNPIIMAWRNTIGIAFPDQRAYAMTYIGDYIAWCGFGVAYCLAANGLRPVFGKTGTKKFMWAAAWAQDCAELIRLKPPYPVGAILTFTRSGGGHVAILEGETADSFIIRGCNQSDQVNVVSKSKDQFTAATWPRTLPIPAYVKPPHTIAGVTSSGKES